MKKIILIVLFITLITGCENKLRSEADVELTKGSITSICKRKDNDNVITTTSNYDASGDIMNMKIETLYKFKDKESFDLYLNESKEAATMSNEEIVYKYAYNEKKMELLTVLAYTKLTLANEVKPVYNVSSHIKTLESNGETCELIGTTRSELGLSK